jgi:hypothetical protein
LHIVDVLAPYADLDPAEGFSGKGMVAEGDKEEASSIEVVGCLEDQRRHRRLTLALIPHTVDEVTVEDILDDDFDSDTSGSQGECSYLTNPLQTAFLAGVEVDQYRECTNGDSAEELRNSKQTTESNLKEQF